MRLLLLALVLALVAPAAGAEDIPIRSRQVFLSNDNPDIDRVDSLEFRGGIELLSSDSRFGGLSGLTVSNDGSRVTAGGDQGNWFVARLLYDARERLAGATGGRIFPIHDRDGRPVRDRNARDAESLFRLPDGALGVGFERMHRLMRYSEPGATGTVLPAPLGLSASPPNGGAEAVVRLADGRLLVFSEQLDAKPGIAAAWIGTGRDWRAVGYRRSGIFQPVGAARHDDGTIFVLERRFTTIGGLAARIVQVPADRIVAGTVFEGHERGQLAPPLIADNFEGIAVRRGKAGETLIYIVSDDNFHDLQRTYLLLFALAE